MQLETPVSTSSGHKLAGRECGKWRMQLRQKDQAKKHHMDTNIPFAIFILCVNLFSGATSK